MGDVTCSPESESKVTLNHFEVTRSLRGHMWGHVSISDSEIPLSVGVLGGFVRDCPSAIIKKARRVNDLRALIFLHSNHFF